MCLSTWPNFTTVLYPCIFSFSLTDFSLPCSLLGGGTPQLARGSWHWVLTTCSYFGWDREKDGCVVWKGSSLGV